MMYPNEYVKSALKEHQVSEMKITLISQNGWMAEWSIALSWKGSEPKGSVGSNPTPTAK